MARRVWIALLCLAGMTGSAAADLTLFRGGIHLDSLQGTSCPPGQGLTLPAAMRLRVKSTQAAPETLTVAIAPLAGGAFVKAENDGTFQGADQVVSGGYILNAARGTLPQGKFNLIFNPPTITSATTNFTVH